MQTKMAMKYIYNEVWFHIFPFDTEMNTYYKLAWLRLKQKQKLFFLPRNVKCKSYIADFKIVFFYLILLIKLKLLKPICALKATSGLDTHNVLVGSVHGGIGNCNYKSVFVIANVIRHEPLIGVGGAFPLSRCVYYALKGNSRRFL